MTHDDPARPDEVVQSYSPSAAERIAVPTRPHSLPDPVADASEKSSALDTVKSKLTGGRTPDSSAHRSAQSGPDRMTGPRKLPPLKGLERYISAFFKLGRTEYMAKNAKKRVTRAELRMDDIEGELSGFGRDISQIWRSSEEAGQEIAEIRQALEGRGTLGSKLLEDIAQMSQRLDQHHGLTDRLAQEFQNERTHLYNTLRSETSLVARVFADLSRRIDQISGHGGAELPPPPARPPAAVTLPRSDGFETFKDSFYHRLENRYRGSLEEITNRLRIYLPDVEAAVLRCDGKPVMDLGCGRGEWLALLKSAGIAGFGIDTNAVQIEQAREDGLDVRLGDALQALADQPDDSLAMLSAHHLVEHLPFDAVAWIAREAQRVLAPGGVLLFETPHTRNVLVGATTFHTDPTHLKPMPEQVLTVLFDTAGFDPVEVRALNPHARFQEFLDMPDVNDELAFLFFGPQDLAVLGTKPKSDKD